MFEGGGKGAKKIIVREREFQFFEREGVEVYQKNFCWVWLPKGYLFRVFRQKFTTEKRFERVWVTKRAFVQVGELTSIFKSSFRVIGRVAVFLYAFL